jgi:hypothetical protein
MKRGLQLLAGGTLAFWLAISFPVYRIGGEVSLATATLAGLLCLVPTSLTMLWAGWARDQSPHRQLAMLLGGTGLRMVVVLGAGLLLSPHYPAAVIEGLRLAAGPTWTPPSELTVTSWWVWLMVFYLVTLALEVGILAAAWMPKNPRLGDAL